MVQLKEFRVNLADGDFVIRVVKDVNSWLSESKVAPLQFFVLGNSLVIVYSVSESADAQRGGDSFSAVVRRFPALTVAPDYVERRADSVPTAPSVVAKEPVGVDEKLIRANILVPARSAQKNTAVLCQAGVFGFPPGASMVPGDPPVPAPLVSPFFDVKEWSDFFTESR